LRTKKDLVKICAERYTVKPKRVNGMLHIVPVGGNIVVKKTKTHIAAVRWVIDKVEKELLELEKIS